MQVSYTLECTQPHMHTTAKLVQARVPAFSLLPEASTHAVRHWMLHIQCRCRPQTACLCAALGQSFPPVQEGCCIVPACSLSPHAEWCYATPKPQQAHHTTIDQLDQARPPGGVRAAGFWCSTFPAAHGKSSPVATAAINTHGHQPNERSASTAAGSSAAAAHTPAGPKGK